MIDLASFYLSLQTAGRLRDEASRLKRLVRRLRRQPEDPAPGDWQSRSVAYRNFASAALATSQDLQLIAAIGTPPKLLGALWSWPIAFRASRRVPDRFLDTLSAMVEISLLGDRTVLQAAGEAGEALADVAASFPEQRGRQVARTEFSQRVDIFNDRLAGFITVARHDLQVRE